MDDYDLLCDIVLIDSITRNITSDLEKLTKQKSNENLAVKQEP